MIVYSLILAFSTLAALWSGFYFGYLKRENKKPEFPEIKFPNIRTHPGIFKVKEKEPEDEKVNTFYE